MQFIKLGAIQREWRSGLKILVKTKYAGAITLPVVVALLVLVGCATAAQRQATTIREGLEKSNVVIKQCGDSAINGTAGQVVFAHIPRDFRSAPISSFMNNDKPASEEVQSIIQYNADIQPCRKMRLEAAQQFTPSVVPVWIGFYTDVDAVMIKLAKGEMSWGDAAGALRKTSVEWEAKRQEAFAQIDRNLAEQNQQELSQRQAAAAALAQWSYQQQLINSLNKPVQTSCTRFGNTVNCLSN